MEARPKGSHQAWRRVGRHRRTGRFYWYGTSWATHLRHGKKLAGSIDAKDVPAFQAWASSKGLTVRTQSLESRRETFIRLLNAEIGVQENPLGSNRGPRVDYYRKATTLWPSLQTGWPWCQAFIVRIALDAGYDLPRDMRTASVDNFFTAAAKHGLIRHDRPRPGDVVECFKRGQHVEAVTGEPTHGSYPCVGGNTTAPGKHGSAYEGTQVALNMRARNNLLRIVDLDRLP